MDNSKRTGFATSSQMHRVCASLKNGNPSQAFFGYAEEVAGERFSERPSSTEVKTQPIKWGSLMEIVLFNKLGIGWTMEHKNTIIHEEFAEIWSGTPDLIADKICAEVKCYGPKKWASMAMCMDKGDINLIKEKYTEEYWQVVSNAILSKKDKAMLICFMPKKAELLQVFKDVEETDFLIDNNLDPKDYYFLNEDNIESFPYLNDDAKVDSIQSIEFDVPMQDKIFLLGRIEAFENEVLKYEA